MRHEEHCRCGGCLQAQIGELEAEITRRDEIIASTTQLWRDKGKRIAELETERDGWKADALLYCRNSEDKGKRIAELESAIVDYRQAELVYESERYNLDKAEVLLDLHRRFHNKVGCPGMDCYVCEAENEQ